MFNVPGCGLRVSGSVSHAEPVEALVYSAQCSMFRVSAPGSLTVTIINISLSVPDGLC